MVKKRGNHAGRFQKKETLLRRSFLETCMQEGRGGASSLPPPAASKDPWFSAHFLTVLGVREVPESVPDGAGGYDGGKDTVREEKSEAAGPRTDAAGSGSNDAEPASGGGGGETRKRKVMMGIVAKQKVLDERKRVQAALARWDLGGSGVKGPGGRPQRLSRGALMLAVKALSQYTSQTAALSVVLGSVQGAGLVGIDALSLIIREIRSGHKALDQAGGEGALQRQFDFLSQPAVAADDPIMRAVEEKAGAPKRKRAKTLATSIKALPASMPPVKIDDLDKQAVAALQLLFGGSAEGKPEPALSPQPPAAPPPAAGPTQAAAGPEERTSPLEMEAAQTLAARMS